MTDKIAYRLATPERWAEVMAAGVFEGDPHDIADGFIHLSAAAQVEGTLLKHYNQHERLVLAEVDLEQLSDSVKWEVSRGGDLFPHVYGTIPTSAVTGVRLIGRDEDGGWIMPNDLEGGR